MHLHLIHYFDRFLDQLKTELLAYEKEEMLWETAGEIKNSGGNLAYHLVGNLNYYIGSALGNRDYVRDRPLEFTIRDVPREKLLKMIDATKDMIREVLQSRIDLEKAYPKGYFRDAEGTIGFLLLRLVTHLSYHVGQVNYHRRLIMLKK